ncbi:sensor box histidine kinase [Natrialba magadii ATCC 43099]|uniref:histidine kinase n=1 Tax=Natrialba magadii (strain ATCC 43099 / DSM 3394 / CCM 3739 / CIP 104546 / IAM 13178 / JCM 8861 / NBRC 102185 / NCIMB 2190 / MS3) TaxID=547559 RepID=D3SRZ2_NATMM|nr:ATP-binding protein [Natrialba magadii]ADD06766.1 sensor box histidine kinase [Natrialba magadii ATCC 43099]ELY27798.1 multi-sensor signal transduction histidine kinase [Natrialba magadii ATCC 43099]
MTSSSLVDSVAALGRLASELDALDSVTEVYTHAIRTADHVLEFDAAIICTVENGVFEPQAIHTTRLIPAAPLTADAGIAGKTHQENETYVVGDLTTHTDAEPASDAFRSVLSIPLEDGGVVQFHATEPDAFSEADQHLGELFVATVTSARNRVSYESALETERDQFAALFENVPDAALQYRLEDGRQVIDAVNSAFIRVFGFDAEDVVGEPLVELIEPATHDGADGGSDGITRPRNGGDRTLPPAQTPIEEGTGVPTDRPRTQPHLAETELSERTDVEVVRETADGPRPFLLRNIPVATTDGTTRGYLIYTDLTELKLRERELERKNERLDKFASIVSHDLRNPLTVADGYLDLALEDASDDIRPALEEIQDAHGRMQQLIEDVLTMARGETVDNPSLIDVATVAEAAWDNVDTASASLETTSSLRIEADRTRLLRLLENLFRNAVEHAGTDATVRVTSLEDGFAVEDDGPGISSERRDAIFESGHTDTAENTGLGLAIVDQIATEHGWTVDVTSASTGVSSETEPGARFEFTGCRLGDDTATVTDRERDRTLDWDRELARHQLEGWR